jgi:hypothetical protein
MCAGPVVHRTHLERGPARRRDSAAGCQDRLESHAPDAADANGVVSSAGRGQAMPSACARRGLSWIVLCRHAPMCDRSAHGQLSLRRHLSLLAHHRGKADAWVADPRESRRRTFALPPKWPASPSEYLAAMHRNRQQPRATKPTVQPTFSQLTLQPDQIASSCWRLHPSLPTTFATAPNGQVVPTQ